MDIDNAQKNTIRVTHDYTIGDIVYVEMNGIYHKLDYIKYGLYRITEVFTNGKVIVQHRQVN